MAEGFCQGASTADTPNSCASRTLLLMQVFACFVHREGGWGKVGCWLSCTMLLLPLMQSLTLVYYRLLLLLEGVLGCSAGSLRAGFLEERVERVLGVLAACFHARVYSDVTVPDWACI